ncbi:hypothetical protein BDD43_0618 [Mucilaginibacter gracilis]|uniref:Uncharacterized protein n=3 Tax=Mucilaginibacter TaxID=423349 RepID=H1YIL6_9SPHI|nr:hypothetical protein [Mucilaginibacter gracilis]EHQ26582.1 hypothetical protein Mucpa_2460 [Mucilaginibacter paludis DSM 18603]RKR80498.1 hypothetical protein BDD43_0618 [Mucilaginibacter gracilis]
MAKSMHITRKVQLLINSADKDFVYESIGKLMKWQNICFKCANLIYTHHFLQEQIAEMVYLAEGTRLKLTDHNKDSDGMLVSSRTNSTYKILTNKFKGQIPSNIFNNLNSQLVATFIKERSLYYEGERSIKNFKRTITLPFSAECIRQLSEHNETGNFTFTLFGIPFKTYLGNGFDEKRDLFKQVITSNLKMATSFLKIEQKKIYLLATFVQEQQTYLLNEEVIAEASLSLEIPLLVKVGRVSFSIGTKEEFLYRRLAIQTARSRVQTSVNGNRSGHGRKRKRKPLEHYLHLERDYIDHKLHVYSRRLIDFCLKHRAATLILTDQQEKEEAAKAEPFLLRNWSYGQFKDKIAFKAAKVGINLIVE